MSTPIVTHGDGARRIGTATEHYNGLRRSLREAYRGGAKNRRMIDKLVAQQESDLVRDLHAVYALVPLVQLALLSSQLESGLVARNTYIRIAIDGRHSGCLVHWLLGVESNEELFDPNRFPTDALFLSAVRITRAWDYHELAEATVRGTLAEAIRQRICVNDLEDSAVMSLRTHAVNWQDVPGPPRSSQDNRTPMEFASATRSRGSDREINMTQ